MTDHIAVFSDIHGNSKVALSVAGFMLDGDTALQPNAAQRWLNENYLNNIDKLKRIKRRGDTLTVVLNGDITEGDLKARTYGVHVRNPVRIAQFVTLILEPLYKIADRCIFISGTPSHVGIDGNLEEAVADDCTIAVPEPTTGRKLWSHACLDVQGRRINIRHVGPVRGKAKLRRKALDDLAEDIIIQCATDGEKLPDLSIHSHGHFYCDTHDNYPVRVITTPAWQLAPDYMYGKPIHAISDIGSIIISVKNGELECHPILYPVLPEKALTIQSILQPLTSGKN